MTKINSSTIVFTKESSDFQNLEKHLKRIASENNIVDVSEITIKVSKDQSLIKFKKADNEDVWYSTIDELQEKPQGSFKKYVDRFKQNPDDFKRYKNIVSELEILADDAFSLEFKDEPLTEEEQQLIHKVDMLYLELDILLDEMK